MKLFQRPNFSLSKGPLALVAALSLGGCVSQSPEFSWYHPMGGEHLFAFDANECEGQVLVQGRQLGTDLDGPFFSCMHERGYYLVNEGGVLQGPAVATRIEPQSVTQQ